MPRRVCCTLTVLAVISTSTFIILGITDDDSGGGSSASGGSECFRTFCEASAPLPSFACDFRKKETCDEQVNNPSYTIDDIARIQGMYSDSNSTSIPYEKRAIRRSSLDPSEYVASFDEVWTDGLCLSHAWTWRPWIDAFYILFGMDFLFRVYVLEKGAAPEHYDRLECDLQWWTNSNETNIWWKNFIRDAKEGQYVQTIDNGGHFCTSSPEVVSPYRHPLGQCQVYPNARYDTERTEMHRHSDSTQYLFTFSQSWNERVHIHEMIHTAQNAMEGQRLFIEGPDDGECCTVYMEHIGYLVYQQYVDRDPIRFVNQKHSLVAGWKGWEVTRQIHPVIDQGHLPEEVRITFPNERTLEARKTKYHTAALFQRVLRLYHGLKTKGGDYINHAWRHILCSRPHLPNNDNCVTEGNIPGSDVPDAIGKDEASWARVYAGYGDELVMDNTYCLKNIATIYFIYKANEHAYRTSSTNFTTYDFYNYELQSQRQDPWGFYDPSIRIDPSEREMFALAGFPSRQAFLKNLHEYILHVITSKKSPVEVGSEITQPQDSILLDIQRFKTKNLITDMEGTALCNDDDMPILPRFECGSQ